MNSVKKTILIDADKVIDGWSGGLHYVANFVFLMSQNQYIRDNYNVVVYGPPKED